MGAWCTSPAPAWPRRPADSRRLSQPVISSTEHHLDGVAVQNKLAAWHSSCSSLRRVFGGWRRTQKAFAAKRSRDAARWLHRQVPELRDHLRELREQRELPAHYSLWTQRPSQLRSGLGRSRPILTNRAAVLRLSNGSSQLSRRSSAPAPRLPPSRGITAGVARLANATRSASDRNARAESGENATSGMVSGRASVLILTSGTSTSSTGTTRRCRPPRPTNLRSRRVIAARVGATGSASSATRALL